LNLHEGGLSNNHGARQLAVLVAENDWSGGAALTTLEIFSNGTLNIQSPQLENCFSWDFSENIQERRI
jgi:hypothetical protein